MSNKIDVEPVGRLNQNLTKLRKRIADPLEKGLREAAQVLLTQSNEFCPKETMALHDSGRARQKGSGLKSVFIVGYGSQTFLALGYGEDRERRPPYFYAFYVHMMHPTHAEFLRRAVPAAQQQMIVAINSHLGIKA